jgi:hypothetical protein
LGDLTYLMEKPGRACPDHGDETPPVAEAVNCPIDRGEALK